MPTKPLRVVSGVRSSPSQTHFYAILGGSIQRADWTEFSTNQITRLQDLDTFLETPLLTDLRKPSILDAEFRILIESNLENVLKQSLIYHVKHALHQLTTQIALLPSIPFSTQPWRYEQSSTRAQQTYIPDYTALVHNESTDDQPCLAIGDVKLIGETKSIEPLSEHLGQVLWYCVCQRTRYGFIISDHSLVVIEFTADSNDPTELSRTITETIAQAEREQSWSPALEDTHSRTFHRNSHDSSVSPNDRHQSKRPRTGTHKPVPPKSSSPLPPLTPSPPPPSPALSVSFKEVKHGPIQRRSSFGDEGYSASSSPNQISSETVQKLVENGSCFTARMKSFPWTEDTKDEMGLALFGLVRLAHLTYLDRKLRISKETTEWDPYLQLDSIEQP